MAFIVEYVPEADIEKYGLRALNEKAWQGDGGYQWVIDRERDIYLRYMGRGDREEEPYRVNFDFYWKGTVLWIAFEKRVHEVPGVKCETNWEFWGWQIPPELMPEREAILAALKEALVAYKDNGMFAGDTNHIASFKNF